MIIPLTPDESRAALHAATVARLGCVDGGDPYVVPVYFVYEDDTIYVHSAIGRKISALRSHPRACIQVDDIRNEYTWSSVIASGPYEEIDDTEERKRILRAIFARYPHLTPVEASFHEIGERSDLIVFRVRIENLTGVREGTSSGFYDLKPGHNKLT